VIRQDLLLQNRLPEVHRDPGDRRAHPVSRTADRNRRRRQRRGQSLATQENSPLKTASTPTLAGTYASPSRASSRIGSLPQALHWFIESTSHGEGRVQYQHRQSAIRFRREGSEDNTVKHFTTDHALTSTPRSLERADTLLIRRPHREIVPLILGISATLSHSITPYKAYLTNWFSSFGRIPSALLFRTM
jgi:hypothetical protein